MLRRSFLVLLTTAGLASAQAAAEPERAPSRVHAIGASVSGGFRDGPLTGAAEPGDTVSMQHLLKAWCGEHARATAHPAMAMQMMFTNPEAIGSQQVKGALAAEADAVVAVDFVFWYAYGPVGGDELEERSAKFAKGLAQVAKLEMPVLLGDLPDMKGAARRMLDPKWIPSQAVLAQLNARLATFAAKHTNVRILPIADAVRRMKTEGIALPLEDGEVTARPGALLQGDQLHANRLGMAYLGFTMQDSLRALFPEDHALRAQQWTFAQFVEACGAEDELAALRAAPAAAGAEGAGGK